MKTYLLFPILFISAVLYAQDSQEISTGAGYSYQSYVNIEAGTEARVLNAAWDIAFSVSPGDAGIFINESVGSGAGLAAIQLFFTLSGDFSAIPEASFFEQFPLSNPETTWSYGAFNEPRIPDDPTDFGWGYYDADLQEVTGFGVFVVRLRNGDDLKIQIQSLANDVYAFRYAHLDGSGEVNETILKSDHTGKLLAYYSFVTQNTVDIEPAGFDLVFCRYTAHLADPGGGDPIPYLVTGVLSGPGVQVAQADGIDPQTVMFESFQDSLSDDIETIGHDWKEFDLGAFMWILAEDRVYFVKTENGRVWKIQFTEFAGSSSGTAVFTKTDLGIISSVKESTQFVDDFKVFPNPTNAEINVEVFISDQRGQIAELALLDAYGRTVSHEVKSITRGWNTVSMKTDGLVSGLYYLTLSDGDATRAHKIQVMK